MSYKKDSYIRFILRELKMMNKENLIENYVNDIKKEKAITFQNEKEIVDYFNLINSNFNHNNTEEELTNFLYYTGTSYTKINALLRHVWDYEINGKLTKENEKTYLLMAEEMQKSIRKVSALPDNIITYRGTNIKAFTSYNITSIEDISSLKNEYIYDNGFVSTSLLESGSLFQKQTAHFGTYNIEMKYIIPKDSQDGIPIYQSYYTDEFEYLLNKGSLIKIIDTQVANDKAYITCVLVPEKLWSVEYKMEMEHNNAITRH